MTTKTAIAPAAAKEETRAIDGHDLTFKQFQRAVDVEVAGKVGVGLDDLADFNIWDAWDAGNSVKETARQALEEDGTADEDFLDEMFDDDDDDNEDW